MDNQGTPEEWIEILHNYNTVIESIQWWENICKATWAKEEASLLRKTYIRHLAKISGSAWQESPIPNLPKWVYNRAKEWKESGRKSPIQGIVSQIT